MRRPDRGGTSSDPVRADSSSAARPTWSAGPSCCGRTGAGRGAILSEPTRPLRPAPLGPPDRHAAAGPDRTGAGRGAALSEPTRPLRAGWRRLARHAARRHAAVLGGPGLLGRVHASAPSAETGHPRSPRGRVRLTRPLAVPPLGAVRRGTLARHSGRPCPTQFGCPARASPLAAGGRRAGRSLRGPGPPRAGDASAGRNHLSRRYPPRPAHVRPGEPPLTAWSRPCMIGCAVIRGGAGERGLRWRTAGDGRTSGRSRRPAGPGS